MKKKEAPIKQELLWKILELTFVIAFLKKDCDGGDKSLNLAFDFNQNEDNVFGPKNILLTKCVFSIVNETLTEFQAVLPSNSGSQLSKFQFDIDQ